jgi:hypothetical protein
VTDPFIMQQQDFVDRLFDEYTTGQVAMGAVLWSVGRLTRAEQRMRATLSAICAFRIAYDRHKNAGFSDAQLGAGFQVG